jgi:ABC-type antimicrobial peptide transport system permease subunit
LAASFLVTKLVESRLFGLRAMDPVVLGGAVLAMVAIGLAAAYTPARRASRLNPAIALHSE